MSYKAMLFCMNEFYSHKPTTYSYREVNNNVGIEFCTCVEKLQLH
jgi:hypothetical protein